MPFNKKHTKASTLHIIIAFTIFPLYTLPWIIIGMYKKKKWAFVLWSIFMGLVGILWPPTGDLYRYTEDFYLYKGLELNYFLFLISVKFDYLLSFLTYLLGYLDLNFDLSRFIYNFIGYNLLGSLYLKIVSTNNNLNTSRNIILSLVAFIGFSFSGYLFRYSLSSILFIYGTYLLVYENKNSGYLFVVLAILNHASFIILFIGLTVYRSNLFNYSKRTLYFFIALCLSVNSDVLISLFYKLPLPVEFVTRYSDYLDGKWAGEYLTEKSWKFQLMHLFSNCLTYYFIVVYIFRYKKENEGFNKIVNMILLLCLITLPFATIHGRFLGILAVMCKISILKKFQNNKTDRVILKYMFLIMIIASLLGIYSQRRQLGISDMYELTYKTTFQILSHSYNQKWIDKNVNLDGSIIKAQ